MRWIRFRAVSYTHLVVYQALYGDFKVWVRPLSMFLEEVDREKYPDASQKYRFERVRLVKDVYKRQLEEKLGAKLYICDEAQLCGALGAALFAYEKCQAAK